MPDLEQRQPFSGEFEKPLVSTKDRVAIQLILMPESEEGKMAWLAEYADDVSRAFVADPGLVALAKTDHKAAAAVLKKALNKMRGLSS